MSAATDAATRNDTIVNLTPSRSCSELSCLRQASSSVMSASSLWVTWGIITQLRARFGAEIRWIRERCTRSTGPNFSKSTLGHGSRFSPAPEPLVGTGAPAAAGAGAPSASRWTSSLVIRPLRPLPVTDFRLTPSSRARRRAEGLA